MKTAKQLLEERKLDIYKALENAKKEEKNFFILASEDMIDAIIYEDYQNEDSEEDFMEYLVENFIYDNVDEKISYYIDTDKLGRDLYYDYASYTPEEVIEALEDALHDTQEELDRLDNPEGDVE